MLNSRGSRCNGGIPWQHLFVLISTFCSRIVMSLKRIDSFKWIIDHIHKWANPQNNDTNNSNNIESSGQHNNIDGNSTTRPPEGEEHVTTIATAIKTTTTATAQLSHNNNTYERSNSCNSNEEQLVEVLVVSVNDTKMDTTSTVAALATAPPTMEVATTSTANTADVRAASRERIDSDDNTCDRGNNGNEATTRRNGVFAPIAREEEDAEETWSAAVSEEEEYVCCCTEDGGEQCCQIPTKSTTTSTGPLLTSASTVRPMQRTKSRVRTYLKKCRDRLTGQHQQTATTTTASTAIVTATMASALNDHRAQHVNQITTTATGVHLKFEKHNELTTLKVVPSQNANQNICQEQLRDVCALLATSAEDKAAASMPVGMVKPAEAEYDGEEDDQSTSEAYETVYEDIDFSISSTLMDSSSSNVSVSHYQTPPLTSARKRDAPTLADVNDSADLPVECATRRQQHQTKSQQNEREYLDEQSQEQTHTNSCSAFRPLVKEEQLARAIQMYSSTAALIDKHLATIYPVYAACTRAILIRQARDLLVCSYFGCLQSFEDKFLCKFAEIAAELRQRHAIGENVLWREGWPLATPTGEVILQLGALEDALFRPGDICLCVKIADETVTPQLYAVWRSTANVTQLQQQQQQQQQQKQLPQTSAISSHTATLQSHCIDFNAPRTTATPTHLSALTLEMLTSDELPQLLQNLLVGVEHSIERVSFNELQIPGSTSMSSQLPITTTTTPPLVAIKTNNNSKINSNTNIFSSSPKCALRRSELITKNKILNNKFMLRRLTNRQDSMNSTSSGQSCGSSGSTSSDELLRCIHHTKITNNNNNLHSIIGGVAANNGSMLLEPMKTSASATNSASTSPALPLFCLGSSFPHIDSDEENADEKRSAGKEDQIECEIVSPTSINDIPEKLLTASGIYLPGTRDLKGQPIVTVDAECLLVAGLNCYEIATVLLYYSTITERILIVNANDRTTQQPSTQQQQTQAQQPHHQSEQPSISRPSTPKTATAVVSATTAFANSTTVPVTSNDTTVTVVKSPAHAQTTITENNTTTPPTFTILIAIEKPDQMCVIDLICQSLRLLTRQIAYCEILAVCLECSLLQQQQQNVLCSNRVVSSSSGENSEGCTKDQPRQHSLQHSLKFISVNEVTTSVAPSQIPCGKLQGMQHHDARKWREFFAALEPFQRQCATAGQRLVAAMSDIRSADLQGLPTRRQLYAQHRALSRALMDSELHNLRKRGGLQLARLQELAKSFTTTAAMATSVENSHNHNDNIKSDNHSINNNSNNNSQHYYYGWNSNRHNSSGNKLLSTISSISHFGLGGSYSFSMHLHQQQQQQSQHSIENRLSVSKYSAMTSCDGTNNNTTATATATEDVGDGSTNTNSGNLDVAISLYKVALLFNEVDRAAKRLEQLTEQRRERLRELTRQRALEDEINEVTSWMTSDGNETLQRFASLQLDCETAIKEQEHEFERYYFISMKHLAKGRDLHDAAMNVEALRDSAVNLKSALDCFAEKLEVARERIEAASRLQQLLTLHNREPHIQQEIQRLADVAGVTMLLDKYLQEEQHLAQEVTIGLPNADQSQTSETTNQTIHQNIPNETPPNKPNSLNLNMCRNSNLSKQQQLQQQLQHVAVITSTPMPRMNRLSHRSSSGIGSFDGQTCQCWRESRNLEDMDELLAVDGEEELEDGEEGQSKIADSGVGGCERCEGNLKLTRVCSCQSLNEAANLYDKSHNSDELDFECYERPAKRYHDIHSPIEANAHLQYHASSLELSKLEELSCLDPKIQKTLLLIMREMIGTERDYVHSLNYVIENYVDELLREDIPQPLRGQRNVIFGNIEKIFEFHKWHFLSELERYERNPLKVGIAFLEMESKFYLYALYNKNKPKSDTLMSEYGAAFFKSKQFELNDKMDLASYLLKPVQRMGKYALLLQQLVKACNAVEGTALQEIAADVEELTRAEEMVKFQLRHGNDLLAMDSLRDCDVNVKEQGRLLRQNEFLVWQGRGGKKSLRQIFLFEDLVLFSKARRFPDQKNLDIYIYKNSIKTSDIGLTAHVGDSKTKFEIWFRKRKPEDTWTLQCMSEDIKNAWTEEISKLLWKQANRNREIRLAEMSSMGIGSKPCLDIRPSNNQINDRSITISQLGKAPKLRHSFAGMHLDGTKSSRRPNSLISESSLSSGTSSSSLSTGSSSGPERVGNTCNGKSAAGAVNSHHALELINETQTLMLGSAAGGNGANTSTLSSSGSSGRSGNGSGGGGFGGPNNGGTARSKRSTTLVSQLSMESGILSDISMTPDQEQPDATSNWLNAAAVAAAAVITKTTTAVSTTSFSANAINTTPTTNGTSTVIMRRQRIHHTKQHEQQHQESAPTLLQERISGATSHNNPYLREFNAERVNL